MTSAVNLFLRETVNMKHLPFTTPTMTAEPSNRTTTKLAFGRGCMKGKIWMADDFDAPLDEFNR